MGKINDTEGGKGLKGQQEKVQRAFCSATHERSETTIIMRTQGIAGAMMLFLAATIVSVSGVFIAGGWSDIEITNPELLPVFNFAVEELPELFANNLVQNMTQANNETLEIC